MKISTRGRYALRVLIDISQKRGDMISVSELAEQENLSTKYLEKIISLLLKANLVVSHRGAFGGYTLARSAKNISVAEVLSATDDMPDFGNCSGCKNQSSCNTADCWQALSKLIYDFLSKVSIQSLLDKTGKFNQNC